MRFGPPDRRLQPRLGRRLCLRIFGRVGPRRRDCGSVPVLCSTVPARPPPQVRIRNKEEGMNVLVELTNVSKTYGSQRALDGVSLRVPTGEVTAIMGPSGSGKSTL